MQEAPLFLLYRRKPVLPMLFNRTAPKNRMSVPDHTFQRVCGFSVSSLIPAFTGLIKHPKIKRGAAEKASRRFTVIDTI